MTQTETTHPAYTLLEETKLPDYKAHGRWYRHTKSGAEVFHVHNEDPENMCAYAFKTLPPDSSGVAHILEHTVLSGSREFPLKDPFLHLMKGSVNTFLNAMTYPDKTVYPVASVVEQDLFNLMRVYGDAVFFPLLKPELFAQEGHRLQFTAEGRLELTGVVYNEMKGNYSSHDSIAAEWCYRGLMPDTVYRHDSGGDPAVIPQLTYERFVAFHRRYYHPSNARIVLYGNIPSARYLEFLDQHFLRHFQAQPVDEPIHLQPRWESPREVRATFPTDGEDETGEKSSVTLNWLLFPVHETARLLPMMVLSEILLGHSGSPLQKALLESGLGQDLSPVFGLEADLQEAVFSAGLRGTEPERAAQIEALVFDTLESLVQGGIETDLREAALRRVEFRNRELKSGPNGLRVMGRALRTWLYGGKPDAALRFDAAWAVLQAQLAANPRLFEDMIEQLLLHNPHRTTVIVTPQPNQALEEARAIEAALDRRAAELTPAEREAITGAQRALDELQATPDPPELVAKIPTLVLEQIPREITRIPSAVETGPAGVPIYRHLLNTNGITYLDLAFDIGLLPVEDEALLHVLAAMATEVGTSRWSYDRFSTEVALRTGGLDVAISAQASVEDPTRVRRLLIVRTKALDSHIDEAIDLVIQLFRDLTFADARRVGIVLDEMIQDMIASVIPSGHSHALMRSARGLSASAALDERLSGISQLMMLRALDPEALAARLRALWSALCAPTTMAVNVTAENGASARLTARLGEIIAACPGAGGRRSPDASHAPHSVLQAAVAMQPDREAPRHEFLLASANVSFVAQTLRGARIFEPLYAAQDILAHMLRTGGLWERIRMQGGAYGAFANSRATEGVFSFASYRDPHTTRTLGAFFGALEDAAAAPPSALELERAQIAILGREMRPMVPREQGITAFRRALYGVTDELRQRVRDDYRAVRPVEIAEAAQHLLSARDSAYVAILGGREALNALQSELDGRFMVVTTGV